MSDLCLTGVVKHYGETIAVDGVDLVAKAGSRTAIVGQSGSGKSTLLRMIAGFEAPDAGIITLGETILADGHVMLAAHKRNIGIVSQDGALFPHLDIAQNIAFGLGKEMDRNSKVQAMLDVVELDRNLLSRRPHELSGGQQQRVALARALIRQPRFILLDEPFSALDANLRDSVRKMVMQTLENAGIGSILVTHDQAEALSYAHQIAVMRKGRFSQVGSPADLYLRPHDPETAVFLGEAILLPARVQEGFVECALGRLQADTEGRAGDGQIMVRPEQLILQAATGPSDGWIIGTVRSLVFEGATSTVVIELQADGQAPSARHLTFKRTSIDLPPVGTNLQVRVNGPVHLF